MADDCRQLNITADAKVILESPQPGRAPLNWDWIKTGDLEKILNQLEPRGWRVLKVQATPHGTEIMVLRTSHAV